MSEVDKNKNNANAEDDNNAIVSLFAQCIVDDIADTAVDYGEVGIDELADYLFNGNIEPSLLKLPIVKSVVAAGRLMFSIREGFLLKKALIFLKEFKKGVANPKEIEKRRKAAKNGEKWFLDEAERIYVAIDRSENDVKAKLHGTIYAQYINKNIDYNEFAIMIDITDRVFIGDIEYLKKLNGESGSNVDIPKGLRLQALGLVIGKSTSYPGASRTDGFTITDLGKKYVQIYYIDE